LTILITSPDTFMAEGDAPQVGRRYLLEDVATGTSAQNRAFHALVQEYWRSGAHSYNAQTFAQFRDLIKRDLGAGFESYIYASAEGIKRAATMDEIPAGTQMRDIMGKLKSWADYSKTERRETMDRLIAEMETAGVNTPKYREILAGMVDAWK
jgi:hypothetical protein